MTVLDSLSDNKKNFLVEVYQESKTTSIPKGKKLKSAITKEEVNELIQNRLLVNVKHEGNRIKFNLSIEAQRFIETQI